MKSKNLKPGNILSESSYFVVDSVTPDSIIAKGADGGKVRISHAYADANLQSGDQFDTEEKKTMTELAEIFKANTDIAMTVAYYKKAEDKKVKDYKAEVSNAIAAVQAARVSDVPGLLTNLIENPITKTLPAELRIMRGYHTGATSELERYYFIDMEVTPAPGKYPDPRRKQIDTRTIQWLIVRNVKYSLK